MLHLLPGGMVVVVAVRPLVQPHLGARQRHALRWTFRHRNALAVVVDRDRCLVAMLHGPDDVGWSERRVPSKEHPWPGGHERRLVHHRHVPLPELETDVPLHERKGIVLPDGENDRVAREDLAADDFLLESRFRLHGAEPVELHPCERAVLDDEAHRLEVLDDVHTLFFGVLELPR